MFIDFKKLARDGDEIFAPNSENIIQDELDIIYPDKQVFEFENG